MKDIWMWRGKLAVVIIAIAASGTIGLIYFRLQRYNRDIVFQSRSPDGVYSCHVINRVSKGVAVSSVEVLKRTDVNSNRGEEPKWHQVYRGDVSTDSSLRPTAFEIVWEGGKRHETTGVVVRAKSSAADMTIFAKGL
jgi:hypothetical protein